MLEFYMKDSHNKQLEFSGYPIQAGSRHSFNLDTGQLYDQTPLSIPVEVIAGIEQGPILFVSAAIHGDELNGVEIIHRLSRKKIYKHMKGVLILVPIVNVFGFNSRSRYLPDRRDLNRCFPGRKTGSLASRVANVFFHEIVEKTTHGIDLHTAAIHRTNLPQIRAYIDNDITKEFALSFGAPVVLNSNIRDGSLRQAAVEHNIPMLVYEAGEALRFNESAIRIGLNGILAAMEHIGMLPNKSAQNSTKKSKTYQARSSSWLRAPVSGVFLKQKKIGSFVTHGDLLGIIKGPFGASREKVFAPNEGVIIGEATLPLVNQGDALFNIATFRDAEKVAEHVEDLELIDE